ncbi:pyridoxamine 5'-phosphate oxidase family protein [Micromonospora sp. WMMD975]|uniref:pyridoxamine 5'-phosphate oxidase family protein n=1 Tax=Micromonospora sp. WMMD975 TaxID=3016087 RepID=UPI00249B9778|nr:pyridoxamine 5'-phosphate oxidase family protein [Micromonospora sp. WMMD975]WFE34555.1 pyridoxamine 5'-phosphate oxidase family protein [Micromonospora sp. WMMD975]
MNDAGIALDAYRTCEFATLAKDGTPIAWPTSGLFRTDGKILLTTAIAYPQKAFNVRRDPRVALLFSDPTGSELDSPRQVLVTGSATCADTVHTEPVGDLADFWRMIFTRQPKSGAYLDWPANRFTDFYFMRLRIEVTPDTTLDRTLPTSRTVIADTSLVGGPVLASYSSAVLAGRDETGAPVLVRTTLADGPGGYLVSVPDDLPLAEGPASLLVHRHDDQLWNLHNASVRGRLTSHDETGWVFAPDRLTEPGSRFRAGPLDAIRTARRLRAATQRYLDRRSMTRPAIPWDAYRALRAETRTR